MDYKKIKNRTHKLEIALLGSCDVVGWILVLQFRVLRTGALSEICNDNLQMTVCNKQNKAIAFSEDIN
ncbi:hypothetical protein D1614_17850 [Maribellus luteus]|uniref:Uncharacterized protein n=1 Tax=Maribellus luteus TaxID=2305463 RepID=A0A399SUG5_9BACT|nr:hypothetical protein D1614_17850 [Maribellus luteus]